MRTVLKALSYGDINVQSSRAFANIKAIDPLKRFYRTIDTKIYNGAYEVPTRIYLPGEELPAPNGMEIPCPCFCFSTAEDGLRKVWILMTGFVPD